MIDKVKKAKDYITGWLALDVLGVFFYVIINYRAIGFNPWMTILLCAVAIIAPASVYGFAQAVYDYLITRKQ